MIFFNVRQVRDFLINNGFVFTLRKPSRRAGTDLAVYGSFYKWTRISLCKIELVCPINSKKDLKPEHVKYSSFDNAKEWFDLAIKLTKGKMPSLYKVTLLDN